VADLMSTRAHENAPVHRSCSPEKRSVSCDLIQ